MSDLNYPHTLCKEVIEEHFGRRIVDPYRWLEGDLRSDSRIAGWIDAQNRLTHSYLDDLPSRDVFRKRMGVLFNHPRFTPPVKRADRYFFTFNKGMANQSSLYVRAGTSGTDRLLIDPNAWSVDNSDALGEWGVSDDGKYLAYGVQTGGTDWRTLRVIDVETGKATNDRVEWARYTQITWAPDNSGFFYSRMPSQDSADLGSASFGNHAVYFHTLGTLQDADRLIYSTPNRPELVHTTGRAAGGRYLSIYSTPGSAESALTVVDLHSEDWTPRIVVDDFDAEWTVIADQGSRLSVVTTNGAERRRIVTIDLSESEPSLVEILPEAPDHAVLNDAIFAGRKLLVAYLVDAKTEIRRFNLDGTSDGTACLPGIGTAGALSGTFEENEALFAYTSYDTPLTIYRYDVSANLATTWEASRPARRSDRFVVEQRFYTSKDGTQVPMFIVRRSDVDRPAPTLLYGYGGFRISQLPSYNPLQLAWVEQGGVLAVANIRGGGEYGQSWHQAGQRDRRQNVFDDFIAAAEFLKTEGITSPRGLAIQGESGGGLLVGAVTNQRPDLFDVALPGVAVMDMLRYHRFTGGMLWTGEFGNPDEERAFHTLLTYSPYHTIKEGVEYPAILATTADADDRVVPAHTFKYVAMLQAANIGAKPRLVRIDTRTGHGAGMPLEKIIAQYADMWAFAAFWTGLVVSLEK